MGDAADTTSLVPVVLDNEMWAVLNNVFCNSASLSETKQEKKFSVFPNPFADEFTVYSLQFTVNQQIKVFDVSGREISSGHLTIVYHSGYFEMKAMNWEPGIYFIHIANTVKKIVKQ